MADEKPKIILDDDWKSELQAEREKLAAQEQSKAEQAGPDGDAGEMPPADFPTLVGTLLTQALMYMGAFPDPQTGKAMVSLDYAKFHIDLLGVLEEKTKGNLSDEESKELGQALYELRMRYVDITKMVEKAIREQGGAGGMGGPGAGGMNVSGPDLRSGG